MINLKYKLSFTKPQAHLVNVNMTIDRPKASSLTLIMPTWTPGSYLIREFSKNIISISAKQKKTIQLEKIDKCSWALNCNMNESLSISYTVYAFEKTVRTSFVDQHEAMLNGASIFIVPRTQMEEKIKVSISKPKQWKTISTSLEKNGKTSFTAENFDELVDSPIQVGNQKIIDFQVNNVNHQYVVVGTSNLNKSQLVKDTTKILEKTYSLFNSFPYKSYKFFLHLENNMYGGLEHKNCSSLIYDPMGFKSKKDYQRFLGLVSHEFFHVYNVKRIRPKELGPFDYTKENYTQLLWIAEGLTSYFDDLILCKANILNAKEYLNRIAFSINTYENQPGGQVQTLADSSFDSWIKFYRPNENSINASISYYLKGSLVMLILDMLIIKTTKSRKSLENLLLILWEEYKKNGNGINEKNFFTYLKKISNTNFELIEKYIHTTVSLDFDSVFKDFGIELVKAYKNKNEKNEGYIGILLDESSMKIKSVLSNTPAEDSGLNVNDEIIAINNRRVDLKSYEKSIKLTGTSKILNFLVSRRGNLLHISVKTTSKPFNHFYIRQIKSPTEQQKLFYKKWLGKDWSDA